MFRMHRLSQLSKVDTFAYASCMPLTHPIIELAKHPEVVEVTVVGRPHPKWGERAMAFVTLQENSPYKHKDRHSHFEESLKRFAAKVLPGFARPEWVVVMDELPKTGTGKVLKHVLRGRAAKL